LNYLGPQSKSTVKAMSDNRETLEFLKMMNESVSSLPCEQSMFGDVNDDLRRVLGMMLKFDPRERSSAKDLLDLPIFDSIRNPKLEKLELPKFELNIDLDSIKSFDYEKNEHLISPEEYMNHLLAKINEFKATI
jgi:serine/threonine protein kinase